jgi:hypothetical protein
MCDYTEWMKTPIIVPDGLARKAGRAARKMGISRNRLFVLAISEYFQRLADDKITERLNRVYSREEYELDPGLLRAELELLQNADW